MAVLMVLRTNYEGGYGQVFGHPIHSDLRDDYPPILRNRRYVEIQLSMDRSKSFAGCCYPNKRLVALNENHLAEAPEYDLFYNTTTQLRSPNGPLVHVLVLVPSSLTPCRNWTPWTFLGVCPNYGLRHHLYYHLKNAVVFPRYTNYFVPPHYHAQVFLDCIPIFKTPRHQLSHHPNIHKCSDRQHQRLQIRGVFAEMTNVLVQQKLGKADSKSHHGGRGSEITKKRKKKDKTPQDNMSTKAIIPVNAEQNA